MKTKKKVNQNWRGVLVASDSNLENAIKKLDKSALQIILVIGKKNKLIGTVTDGDIRRGLLKGLTTKDKINSIINRKPIIANVMTSTNQIQKIMLKKQVRQIPILNNKGQVIDLQIWNRQDSFKTIDNEIIFMVGGKGKRLMPLTKSVPKPMLKVKGKPILARLVEKAKNEGFYNIIFITNHLEDVIKKYFQSGRKWGVNIKFYSEKSPLGTAGGLRFINKKNHKPVIVSNGDVITEVNYNNLIEFHKFQNNQVTIAVKKFELENPYGIVRMSREKVVDLVEKPVSKSYVSAGIYVFDPSLFKKIKNNEYLDMTTFINRLLKNKIKIAACPLHENWLDIGKPTDFKKANI
tara:strand:+ start:18 stop:1067 length:1050 start_codon:yes stop_codon:yes gene_type:complete